jgi:translation initiation factor 4E
MSSEAAPASSAPEDASTSSGLPAAAKAAAELAVKTAIAESVTEEGEIKEDGDSQKNGDSAAAAATNGDKKDDGTLRTVFSDPANFNVVHPLYSKWCV